MTSDPTLGGFTINVARAGLKLQDELGRMPAGQNGPWGHDDTSVRATAHWAALFLDVYRRTGDKVFAHAAARALRYLHTPHARPFGLTFYCRQRGGKDHANNIIGQAWVLEALLEDGAEALVPGSAALAVEVGRLLPYDHEANLWHRLEIDGTASAPCWTLNQQVMLAAVLLRCGRITGAADLFERAERFFTVLPRQIASAGTDLPHHHILPLRARLGKRLALAATWRLLRHRWMQQSLGYLSFILYGLSCARLWVPDATCLTTGSLPQRARAWIRRITDDPSFGPANKSTSFRWAYNPTGFEVAIAIRAFASDDQAAINRARALVEQQIAFIDPQTHLARRDATCDPETLSARMYEATRLPPGWEIAPAHCGDVHEPLPPPS